MAASPALRAQRLNGLNGRLAVLANAFLRPLQDRSLEGVDDTVNVTSLASGRWRFSLLSRLSWHARCSG